MELQTIPLKFRVWDDDEKCFGCIPSHQISIGLALLHGDSNQKDNRYIISQDTGLKDKNGMSIYTGDIIKTLEIPNIPTIWVVRWCQEEACCEKHRISGATFGDSLLDVDPCHVEIIGNIWQNPDLLKGLE